MSGDLICVVDCETSGLDPKTDQLLEVCWAYVDVDTAQVVAVHDVLVHATENDAEPINGISPALTKEYGVDFSDRDLIGLGVPVEANIAHNAAFDSSWVSQHFYAAPWLCTQQDWQWPKHSPSTSLTALALAHGVGVVSAHRAYSDVLTLCALLSRVAEIGVSLRDQLEYARKPRKIFVAMAPFEMKDIVKANRFSWDPERRRWWRRMLPAEVPSLPFQVKEVAA